MHAALPRTPEEYARRLYFDTLVYDPRALRYLMELVGVSRLAVGSDYPFNIREKPAGKVVSELGNLAPADREAMTTGNALRFLGLS
jgi:aminocarboxymuconate-semialdehyde decarboxylase